MSVGLSIVVPVYNGAEFIGSSVALLERTLAPGPSSYEIVVVDDGSTDGTPSRVPVSERVRLVSLPRNRGKFGALKAGMAESRGRCRIFTDADVPYDLEALAYIESLVNDRGFHIVVGDRTLPDSVYGERLPWPRAKASQLFSLLVRLLVTGGLFDTQCGLKGFRGDVADALFPLLTIEGFSGDVELLYISLKYNLEIRRIPVRLRRQGRTSLRPGADASRMLWDAAQLRGKWERGLYESTSLRALSSQTYWPRGDSNSGTPA
ncbi:MAG: glycosyltransferase [Thermoanaerobaculia bacterium]